MSNIKELMMSASAGNAEASNVEDLFSIDLWNGNSSTQDIVNGIDLATYGGMLWHKVRDATFDHVIRDSERTQGITKAIHPNLADPEGTEVGVYAFNTNGYSLNNDSAAGRTTNTAGYSYIGYTFRKAARFFDIQTWTGDGVSGRQISHSLQATPGAIFIKKLNSSDDWSVYHRSIGVTNTIRLNLDSGKFGPGDVQAVNSSTFTIGNDSRVNGTSNDTYVAYIFAHHNNDGVFGPNGNLDIIKCGSWTGNNVTQEVDIGFEPAFLLWKNIDVSSNYWGLIDNKREWSTELQSFFRVNGNHAEADVTTHPIIIDGGKIYINNAGSVVNGSGEYMYIAVRRATAIPEQADDVFALSSGSGTPRYQSGFHTDFVLERKLDAIQTMRVGTRLLGKEDIFEVSTGGTVARSPAKEWDFMNGYDGGQGQSNEHAFMWKRAPKYFDVVHYRGSNGNAAFEHQLGIAPSMIWIRNQTGGSWIVGSKYFHNTSTGWDKELELNNSVQENSSTNFRNGVSGAATAPTATQFFVTPNTLNVNRFLYDYFAYVFGEVPGISKMGRYTSNGSNQNIECGFQPSFVMIRIIDATYGGNWYMFDTLRGINTNANDPAIYISDNTVPANNTDFIDLYSTGFTVKDSQINDPVSPYKDYFFYAIA